jgi:predicted amidohydrolase YtcJ
MQQMKILLLLLLTGFLLASSAPAQRTAPDLIFFNGKIFTSDAAAPSANAIAISGDVITAVGSDSDVRKLADERTRQIDLQGHVVIPGINDAHFHFMPDPKGYVLKFPSMTPSWQEILDTIAKAVTETPKGTWIYGDLPLADKPGREATRFVLDKISPERPILLRYDGHGYVINSLAMPLLGISETESDPVGGRYDRVEASNRIDGQIWEYAQWRPDRALAAKLSDEEIIGRLRTLAGEAVRDGITSMQIMAYLPLDRFARLLVRADLPIRVRAIAFSATTMKGRDLSDIRQIAKLQFHNSKVTVGGIKWIVDGTPFERGGALREPYRDRPDWSGKLNFTEPDIASMVRESLMFDQQLIIHSVGDRTTEVLLQSLEKAGPKVDWPSKRVRIEHGDGLLPDLIPIARRYGVVVVENPTHFSLKRLMESRYGPGNKFMPLRSLLDAGIQIAMGSDATDGAVEPMNPFLNIMVASIDPVRPDEAITREQAVVAYTRGSAFAEFGESKKGTLAKGMFADIAVVSQDIFSVPADGSFTMQEF